MIINAAVPHLVCSIVSFQMSHIVVLSECGDNDNFVDIDDDDYDNMDENLPLAKKLYVWAPYMPCSANGLYACQ